MTTCGCDFQSHENRCKVTTQNIEVVFGDPRWQLAPATVRRESLVSFQLTSPALLGDQAVVWLSPSMTATSKFRLFDEPKGPELVVHLAHPTALLAGMGLSSRISLALADAGLSAADRRALAPLMVLRSCRERDRKITEVFACTKLRDGGIVFALTGVLDESASDNFADPLDWGLSEIAKADRMITEMSSFVTHDEGVEIEQKLTILRDADIWSLAHALKDAIGGHHFPNWLPDVGNEFSRFSQQVQLFEVIGNPGERGYVSFIARPDGKFLVKRKYFDQDQLRRREEFRFDVELSNLTFDEYLKEEFPSLQFREMPEFSRQRFDINLESAVTGHCYGIELDEVVVPAEGLATLRQIEIEYYKSRIHHGLDLGTVEHQLHELVGQVQVFAADYGVLAEPGYLSKLTFLKSMASPCVLGTEEDQGILV